MFPLVSVIIPVYNTQNYLARCIESVLCQTYANMEIILVNDGSTDCSLELCEKYRSKDDRIQVVSQVNQGIIAAKRTGIKRAHGEYVMFVDSDDWIEKELLQVMVTKILENACSLVCTNVYMDMSDGTIIKRNAFPAGRYTTKEIARDLFFYKDTDNYGILPYSIAKLYAKGMLEHVLQGVNDNIRYAEDKAIVFSCVYQNIQVCFMDDIYYHYCVREGSICQSENSNYLIELTLFYQYAKSLFEKHEERDYLLNQLGKYLLLETRYAIEVKLGLATAGIPIYREPYKLDTSVFFPEKKKVILYGAGKVGADYRKQLSDCVNMELCGWVDRDYWKYQEKGYDVQSIEFIKETEYNYILVAVRKQEVYQEIEKELIGMGIAKSTIIWGRPYGAPHEKE